jgi:uncharacterized protein (DUF952 family)
MENTVFHLIRQDDWLAALASGQYTPPSLAAEGFIHFSTREQVLDTARRYYAALTDLLLLEVDSARTSAGWRWEDSGHGVFPHLYGPLDLDAVTRVWRIERDSPDADFTWPEHEWTGTGHA